MAKNPSPQVFCNPTILLSGFTLAAIAGVFNSGEAAGHVAALGGMLSFAASVAGNQVQTWLKGAADDLPLHPDDLFRNHHLRTLLTEAATSVVKRVMAGEQEPSDSLLDAETSIGPALDRALDDPHSPLTTLHEWNLADLLTGFVKEKGTVQTLTPEIWSAFLNTVSSELRADERGKLTTALHVGFADALWGLVKLDAAKDKQAFAAVEVLYLSRILEATKDLRGRPDPAPILSHLALVVTELDAEQTKHLHRLLRGQSVIREQLGAHLAALQRIEHKLDGVANLASPLQRYYQALLAEFADHDNVSLPVSTPEGKDETEEAIKIRALFVPPRCSKEYLKPAHLDAAVAKGETLGVPLLPLLQPPGTRIVLLGDPGMGKSTVLQYLIATLADGQAPAEAPDLRGAVPFPFVLRVLARSLPDDVAEWNWDALLDAFCRWNPGAEPHGSLAGPLTIDRAVFRTILEEGRALFLIDGLDEIGDRARREAMNRALWEGFERHPQARWLITSRLVGYEQAELHRRMEKFPAGTVWVVDQPRAGGGEEEGEWIWSREDHEFLSPEADRLYLSPFDDAQQKLFARNWYVARMNASTGKQRAAEFIAAVHQHSHLRVIGRIPNLLYLLALLYRHRKHLPNGRALVYAAISEAYLHNIPDVRQLIQKGTAFDRPLHKKESLLGIVALKMQQQRASQKEGEDGDILVSRGQLVEWLQPHFATVAELDEFLDHVARHSGLLLPRGEEVYGFAHLSFQEYYAACHLQQDFDRILAAKAPRTGGLRRRSAPAAEENEERLFAEYAQLPAWHESLLFLVEKLSGSAPYTEQLLDWMFPQLADDPAKGNAWLSRSAAQLLATLSVDSEIALDVPQREAIWRALWQADCAEEAWSLGIAPSLVIVGTAFEVGVLKTAVAVEPARLNLGGCAALADLSPLAGLRTLCLLDLSNCKALMNLEPLARLFTLQILNLRDCAALADLSPLAGMANLEFLYLGGCTALANLSPLASLTNLRSLHLHGCATLSNIAPLTCLSRLRTLDLSHCTAVVDHSPLADLANLQFLNLRDCQAFRDLSPLAKLSGLEDLQLSGCCDICDLDPLAGLTALQTLFLVDCRGLNDLAPLVALTGLKELDLRGCTGLGDLTPLAWLTGLLRLDLNGCGALDQGEIAKLRKALPNTEIRD